MNKSINNKTDTFQTLVIVDSEKDSELYELMQPYPKAARPSLYRKSLKAYLLKHTALSDKDIPSEGKSNSKDSAGNKSDDNSKENGYPIFEEADSLLSSL